MSASREKELAPTPSPASIDEALLDEFFYLVASIAVRLTKEDAQRHNDADSSAQGGL